MSSDRAHLSIVIGVKSLGPICFYIFNQSSNDIDKSDLYMFDFLFNFSKFLSFYSKGDTIEPHDNVVLGRQIQATKDESL